MAVQFPSTAGDFPFPKGSVVQLSSSETVSSAFSKLVEHQILSAPVFSKKSRDYLGWFDVSALIPIALALDAHIKSLNLDQLNSSYVINEAKSFNFNFDGRVVQIGSDSQLSELFEAGLCPTFKWTPFYTDSPMSEVIQSLTSGVKRVPILSRKSNKVIKIISQSAIIKLVDAEFDRLTRQSDPLLRKSLPRLFSQQPEELGFLKPVVCLDESKSVTEALQLMAFNGIDKVNGHSCIGITDEDGELLTCVTHKDLLALKSLQNVALNRMKVEVGARSVNKENLPDVGVWDDDLEVVNQSQRALTDYGVMDFVSWVRSEEIHISSKTKAAVVKVQRDDTLKKIVAKMAKTGSHRVFITDRKLPIGVASVRDVVALLFR